MTTTGPSRTFSRSALLLCCLVLLAASLFPAPCFGATENDDYDYELDLQGQNDHEEADERRMTGEPPKAEQAEPEKKVFDVIGKMFVSDAERKGIWAFDALNLIPSSSNNKERGGGRGGPAVTFFRDHLLEAGVSEFIEALEPYPTGVAVVEASGHGTLLASVSGKQFILYQLLAPSGSNEGKTEVKAHMVLPSWGLSLLPSFSQLTSTSSKQQEEDDREDIPAATLEGGEGEEEKEDAKEILVLGEEGEWRKVTRRRVVKKLEEKEEDVSLEFFVTLPKEGRVLRVFPETRYLQVVYGRTDRKSFMLDADRILDVQTWKQEHESKMKPGIIPSFVTWGSGHDHLLLSSFKDNSIYHLDPETGELGLFIEDVKGPMGLLLRDNSLHFDRELCFSSSSELRAKIPSSSENKNRQTVNKWIQDRKDEEKQQRGGWDLFVASAEEGAVLRFDGVTGEFVDEFIAAGDLWHHKPIGLGLGPYDGYLYVSLKKEEEHKDKPPGYILRFDAVSGTFVDSLEDVVPSLKEEMTHPSFFSWDIDFEHSPCVREMKPAGMQHGIYRMNWGKQRNTKRPAKRLTRS